MQPRTVAIMLSVVGLLGGAACATLGMYQGIRLNFMRYAAYRKISNWLAAGGYILFVVIQAWIMTALIAKRRQWLRTLTKVLLGYSGITLVVTGYWLAAIWLSRGPFMWECTTDLGGGDHASAQSTCSTLWPIVCALVSVLAVITTVTLPIIFYLIRSKIIPEFVQNERNSQFSNFEDFRPPVRSTGSGNSGPSYSLIEDYTPVPYMSELHTGPLKSAGATSGKSPLDSDDASKRESWAMGSASGHGHYASADEWTSGHQTDADPYSSASDADPVVVGRQRASSSARDSRRTESSYTYRSSDMGHSSEHSLLRPYGVRSMSKDSTDYMLPRGEAFSEEEEDEAERRQSYDHRSSLPAVGPGGSRYSGAHGYNFADIDTNVTGLNSGMGHRQDVNAAEARNNGSPEENAPAVGGWRIANAAPGDIASPSTAETESPHVDSEPDDATAIPSSPPQRERTEDALDDHFARYYRPLSTIASERETDDMSIRTRTTIRNARFDESLSRTNSQSAASFVGHQGALSPLRTTGSPMPMSPNEDGRIRTLSGGTFGSTGGGPPAVHGGSRWSFGSGSGSGSGSLATVPDEDTEGQRASTWDGPPREPGSLPPHPHVKSETV